MMRQFIAEHQLQFPILLDTRYQAAQRYGVRGTPTTFVINRAGKVVGGASGPKDWSSEAAKNLMRQLLREPS